MSGPRPLRPPGAAGYAAALRELLDAADAITVAVEVHDRVALEAANARAERLADEAGRLMAQLGPIETADLADPGFGWRGIVGRLRAAGRRNTLLIERAWALDAATTRLLAGLVRGGTDGAPLYAPTAFVAVERRA